MTGIVRVIMDLERDIRGKRVLLVEDIIDSLGWCEISRKHMVQGACKVSRRLMNEPVGAHCCE
jgi:hypoxanthine-guanine phosphoribosyltransferase